MPGWPSWSLSVFAGSYWHAWWCSLVESSTIGLSGAFVPGGLVTHGPALVGDGVKHTVGS